MRCLVTTAPSGSFDEAGELAQRFGLEAQPRADRAIPELIEVRCADHRQALREMPDGSVDVVLFDPMFRSAGESGALFELVRTLAEHAPLATETLREAQRVARRGVLVKDAPPGNELARLGLRPLPSRRSPRIVFGWAAAQQLHLVRAMVLDEQRTPLR